MLAASSRTVVAPTASSTKRQRTPVTPPVRGPLARAQPENRRAPLWPATAHLSAIASTLPKIARTRGRIGPFGDVVDVPLFAPFSNRELRHGLCIRCGPLGAPLL